MTKFSENAARAREGRLKPPSTGEPAEFQRRVPPASGGLRLPLFPYLVLALIVAATVAYWRKTVETPTTQGEFGFVASQKAAEAALPASPLSYGIRVAHRVRAGQTVASVFENYGLSLELASAFSRRYAELEKKPFSLRRGQEIDFVFSDGALHEIMLEAGPGATLRFQLLPNQSDFLGVKEELPRLVQDRVALGAIESSFASAATQTAMSYEMIDELVDLFSDRVAFHRDFRRGDRFAVIFRQRFLPDGTPVEKSEILAASLEVKGKQLVAIRYVGSDGKARYFNRSGELLGAHFLRYPLKFTRISSYFTTARFHPILKRNRPHNGVDFAAPTGTAVRTVADGRVVEAGWKGGNGLLVRIAHNDRYSTVYAHLSKISVKANSRVSRGEVIGAVGSTGLSTGPHLHFALYDRGRYVDPLKAKLPALADLGKGQMINKRFLARVLFTLDHYKSFELGNVPPAG